MVRANLWMRDRPLPAERPVFAGDADQIAADIAATREIGADELFFEAGGLPGARSIDGLIAVMEQFWELAHRG